MPSLPTAKAAVLYDGDCAFCRKSVAILHKLDWDNRLAFIDIRDSDQPLLKTPQIAGAPLVDEMHLLPPDGGRLYHGFGALRWLAWRLPLLQPFAPLLYLPGIPALGQKLYLWIARNRFRLVPCHGGVCTIQRMKG
jgi:predicted DCC family thiol-disulfide oxidoreductase YuxK